MIVPKIWTFKENCKCEKDKWPFRHNTYGFLRKDLEFSTTKELFEVKWDLQRKIGLFGEKGSFSTESRESFKEKIRLLKKNCNFFDEFFF